MWKYVLIAAIIVLIVFCATTFCGFRCRTARTDHAILGFESRQQRGSRDEQEKRQRKYYVDIKKTGHRRASEQHQGDGNQSAYDDGLHLLSVLGSALPKYGQ